MSNRPVTSLDPTDGNVSRGTDRSSADMDRPIGTEKNMQHIRRDRLTGALPSVSATHPEKTSGGERSRYGTEGDQMTEAELTLLEMVMRVIGCWAPAEVM